MRIPPDTRGRRNDRILAELLHTQRTKMNSLINAIRRDSPDFMPLGLELSEILQLIPEEGALVAPLMTSLGSAVFIVPHGVKEIAPKHVIPLDSFRDEDLNTLLHGTLEQPGWLLAYQDFYNNRQIKNWQATVESLTGRLGRPSLRPSTNDWLS